MIFSVAAPLHHSPAAPSRSPLPLPPAAERVLRYQYSDEEVVHRVFGSACYIKDSFPSVLFLAHQHADSFQGAVLANTNAGGENCHRGAALGALVGAATGAAALPPALVRGLAETEAIGREIDAYITALFPEEAAAAGAGATAGAAAGRGGEL